MEEKKKLAHDIMNDARRAITEGKTKEAVEEIEKATLLYSEIYADDSEVLGDYYTKLAEILHSKLDDYKRAILYYRKASDEYTKLGNRQKVAYINYAIGEIYDVDLDDLDASAEALNTALEIYMSLDEKDNASAECLEKIASVYLRLGDKDIVLGALSKEIDIRIAIAPTSRRTALALHDAGKMCFDIRELDKSMYYLDKAKALYLQLEGEDGEEYKSVKEEYSIVRAYKGCELN